MPKAFPAEFKQNVLDVVAASDQPMAAIARDFGISESCLYGWVKQSRIDDRVEPGVPSEVEAELRELRSRCGRLETENEILRRACGYLAQDVPPKGLAR